MNVQLINIGFGNIIAAQRVIAIVGTESAPVKRVIADARENGNLIDATCGRRTRGVIITDSSHVILSALLPETIGHRFVEVGGFADFSEKNHPALEEEADEE